MTKHILACLRRVPLAWLLAVALPSITAAPAAQAETLRFAAQGDIATLDPHAHNERFNNAMVQHIYEPLIMRGPDLRVMPGLALSWAPVPSKAGDKAGTNRWRVALRPGVRFHDGQPLSADDVVFSIQRAQNARSRLQSFAKTLGQVRRIDTTTVEFDTGQPNPLFVETLTLIPVMNQAWAMAHGSLQPADPSAKQEIYAHRHANGTGPFRNARWQPDVSLALDANPDWWGRTALAPGLGNVDKVRFQPIQSLATRVAALATSAVDLVVDLSPNDKPYLASNPGLKVATGIENRIIYLGLDVKSPQLRQNNPDNPLQKPLVRQALWQAIDYATLQKQVLKGDHLPTGAMVTPVTTGYSQALDALPGFDPAAARAKLALAGYPNGFALGLDCPSDRHPVDEVLCKAITTMWGKVGVQTRLRLQPKALYFAALEKSGADAFLMGWGGATTDAMYTLKPLAHSAGAAVAGSFNYGGIADARLDALIDRAETEANPALRTPLLQQALQQLKQEAYLLPLYRQAILWGMQQRVSAAPRADNRLELFRVKIAGKPP